MQKMKSLLIISILLITSCKADLERLLGIHEWETYHIPQSKHESSGLHVATLSTYHLDFKARFDETCIYDLHSKDQNDINKLYGFSDCNCSHEQNSARFGWRWVEAKKKIEILAYIHQNGRPILFDDTNISMGFINIGEEGSFSIYVVDGSYNFNFNGNLKVFNYRGCSEQRAVRYMCYPYFGGDQTAPHSMNISIKN